MNIKKSDLIQIIESVVRECIEERKDKWIQKAVEPSHKGYCTPMTKSTCTPHRKALAMRFKKGDIHQDNVEKENMQEVAPPGFGPDKKHAAIYNKLMKQYKNNPEAAYATMWSIHNKMNEVKKLMEVGWTDENSMEEAGLTSEASYKVVSPNEVDCASEDKAREIQGCPKVTEAAYKVASDNQVDCADEDKARTIQTEPKVNETAFKKQGSSAKTFKDSPQFPEAVNDPENA